MTFILTEEQEMIRNMARKFSREVLLPLASELDETCVFPAENLSKMSELGFMGMMAPSEYDGADLDTVSYVLALMEMAYGCASTAVVMSVHNSICLESILNYGTDEQKKFWIPKMCSGECIGAFALTEPHAGSDPVAQKTKAVKDGNSWIINGTKQFITTGEHAGVIICTAITNKSKRHKGISAFLIPQGTDGMTVGTHENKMGLRASDTVQLIFEDCRIPLENILSSEGMGFKIAMSGLDCGRIGIAAQSVGVARACIDEAVEYMHERTQFGHPIADFQGLRFRIAEMSTQVEAANLMCLNAALLKDRGRPYTKSASMAKMFASETVNTIAGLALQMFGGYGYCKEYPIERHYRDARVFTIYEGTNDIQRVIISNMVMGPPGK